MKKLLLTVAVVAMAAVSAQAQNFKKGDWYFGAHSTSLVLQHRSTDSWSGTDFDMNAIGGWFFANKFSVDGMVGFDYAKAKNAAASHFLNLGAGVRYYPVGNLFARLGYFGQVSTRADHMLSYLNAKIGYDLFLSEKVFFEPAVYYEKQLGDASENIFGLSLGIGVKF